ncbi:Predicted membrane protein [Chromobacterium violaceum]|uniref:Predicted membrane protein n=1 Tax=Chromobacterium violaceum TaxID=536 RepID=A0A3S4IJF6_CHRVL|nr:Predicted membrane protein [Chromobacterium violaceum]
MKNDACLQQLQLTLVELPEAELRKLLRDYRGYIRGAVADRASESRLLAILADTRELAAGFSAGAARPEWPSMAWRWRSRWQPLCPSTGCS